MARSLRRTQVIGLMLFGLAAGGCLGTRPDELPSLQLPAPKVSASPASHGKFRGQIPSPPDAGQSVKKTNYAAPAAPSSPGLASYQVRICAWVNGKPLFEGELQNLAARELYQISKMQEPERTVQRNKLLKAKLKELIHQEVVLQDAYRKLEKNPQMLDKLKDFAKKQFNKRLYKMQQQSGLSEFEFKQQMRVQGATIDAMKRQMERSLIVTEYMRSRVGPIADQVGLQQIKEYYDTHPNEFKTVDRVEWEDIFIAVGTERTPTMAHVTQLAQYVAKQMQLGQSIEKLLQFDDGLSSTRQGRGYGELRGEIKPPEIEPYLFNMKPGQVGPLVKLSTGIHVFRLVKREYAGQVPFTPKVQAKIRKKLKSEIAQAEFERIVRQLVSRTVIEVNPDIFE